MLADSNRLLAKPFIIEVAQAHREKVVVYEDNGDARFKYNGEQILISSDHQYDLTQATIFGLNERVTMSANSPVMDETGKTLRDKFNEEWEEYSRALEESDGNYLDYGYYVYYSEKGDLVRYSSPYWHRVVAVASSSKLLADINNSLSWKQIRNIFEDTTVGVVGCSVGSNVIHSAIRDLRPSQIKIADKSVYKMENINRVHLGYWDIVKSNKDRQHQMDLALENKTITVARQIYAMDPFVDVYEYREGITEGNIETFLMGNENEPQVDIIVEEVDDPKVKIFIREEARKKRIPLIMVTDAGSCVQLDVLRYDKDNSLPLTFGADDQELYKKMQLFYEDPTNREAFFSFVDLLIGTDYRQDELKAIIERKCEIPTSTVIPQLGSTAAVAGGLVAEAIARIRLGFDYPPRVIFNKRTFEVKISS